MYLFLLVRASLEHLIGSEGCHKEVGCLGPQLVWLAPDPFSIGSVLVSIVLISSSLVSVEHCQRSGSCASHPRTGSHIFPPRKTDQNKPTFLYLTCLNSLLCDYLPPLSGSGGVQNEMLCSNEIRNLVSTSFRRPDNGWGTLREQQTKSKSPAKGICGRVTGR